MSKIRLHGYLKFISFAEEAHVVTFTQNYDCFKECKKDWDITLKVYKQPDTPKTRREFIKAIKNSFFK